MKENILGNLKDNRYHATEWSFDGGLTIRDFFAASAMQGIISECVRSGLSLDKISENAYAAADAMIRYRNDEKI
jgi:hypothetical protein